MEEVRERPRRRPLVRAASEEASSDPSSASGAPCPGDTLPWNLPKHHRIKRSKSASENVLDPAERAVIRIAGRKLSDSAPCHLLTGEPAAVLSWFWFWFWSGYFPADLLTALHSSLLLSLLVKCQMFDWWDMKLQLFCCSRGN